jgi:hypothetical protein
MHGIPVTLPGEYVTQMTVNKRFESILMLATLAAGTLSGCATPPYAAQDSTRTDEERPYVGRLDGAEQGDARRILESVTVGHTISGPSAFRAAFPRGRWSDVPAAARDACDQCELGIFDTDNQTDLITFTVRTADDRPGTLTVNRVSGKTVYSASATIGRFGDRDDLARRLVIRFERAMERYGLKRQLDREAN